MKRFELDNYMEEIIRLYICDRLSCQKIAKKFNASLSGIYDALKRWGISTRGLSESHRVFCLDENYFDEINTEEKAYWLGFIYADGFITNKKSFGIALSIRDKEHLEKFLIAIKSTHPLHDYKTNNSFGQNAYSRILINSKKIYKQLLEKGVLNRKSLILKFPDSNILPKELYKHFIRGYFDGDGSLVLSKNSINFKICGTMEFLYKLIEIFNEISNTEYKYKLFKRYNDSKNNYYLSFGGSLKIYPILRYLYEGSLIYLDRKMKKYEELKNYITINHSRA